MNNSEIDKVELEESGFVHKFKRDGIDHIRISKYGATLLGRILYPNYIKEFYIPKIGSFLSPYCFVNWLNTGYEYNRYNPNINIEIYPRKYRNYVVYAKFFQLCRLRVALIKEVEKMFNDLPFLMYNVHATGVKELNKWFEYPSQIKKIVEHILDPNLGPKVQYPWDEEYPDMLNEINEKIKAIINLE